MLIASAPKPWTKRGASVWSHLSSDQVAMPLAVHFLIVQKDTVLGSGTHEVIVARAGSEAAAYCGARLLAELASLQSRSVEQRQRRISEQIITSLSLVSFTDRKRGLDFEWACVNESQKLYNELFCIGSHPKTHPQETERTRAGGWGCCVCRGERRKFPEEHINFHLNSGSLKIHRDAILLTLQDKNHTGILEWSLHN